MQRRLSVVALIAGWLLAGAAARAISGAQRPERPHAAAIPGVDSVSLKAGWQMLFYEGCRYAVPGSWHPDADSSIAVAPDGSNVSVRMFRITNWSSHKARIKEAFGRIRVVHEDSERRLWFELGNPPRLQHYVDVATGLDVCSGLLEVRGPMTPDVEDTARTIAASIGPAPDR